MKVLLILGMLSTFVSAQESQCYGTTANGYLEGGVQLPAKGINFIDYSSLARSLGRSYVHSDVAKIIMTAYAALSEQRPETQYKYGETGLKGGGQFKPHKTHQNGLSVDFFVPVINKQGQSDVLVTNVLNKFGYDIEFIDGEYNGLNIDYEAMAAHIVALDKAAKASGYGLWRVIFAPELQPFLYETSHASYLRENIAFSTTRSWVRHDEHYHVDFNIPCDPL